MGKVGREGKHSFLALTSSGLSSGLSVNRLRPSSLADVGGGFFPQL